jgi:hypothetical protein
LRFWPFLCRRNRKTPQKYFLKSDLKMSKNLKKSTVVPTSPFFFSAPLAGLQKT